MKKILIGQFERVMGTVAIGKKGDWLLAPQDATETELLSVVERVFARVKRQRKSLTRTQFVHQFFAKGGAPATAYASSAWGKGFVAPEVAALINRLLPADDPYMAELRRQDEAVVAQFQKRQRA